MSEPAFSQNAANSGNATRSGFERASTQAWELDGLSHQLEHLPFWSRFMGVKRVPARSPEDAAQCKLACIIAWMQSRCITVESSAMLVMSTDPAVWTIAAAELAQRRRRVESESNAASGALPGFGPGAVDRLVGLQLALSECEARTAPVTASTVSSVQDPAYVGYQRRRTLCARLFVAAIASFAIACTCDFTYAWVRFRLSGSHPYPAWTSLVANYLILPTEMLFWGFLGASLYLHRRLNEFTEQRTFDHRLADMYWMRLLMGGVTGAMLSLLIVAPTPLDASAAPAAPKLGPSVVLADLGSHAIAIVGGFSVRVVYALLESISNSIRATFSRAPTQSESTRRNQPRP
jgi:hypothetical protein